jgi:asparagine synthase (glutamine-hydrolysing)
MFAIALWDGAKQQLLLARDRLGKKPLCYAHSDKHLIFASELKAILENPEVKRQILPEAIDHYLTFSYIPAPMSIFQDIRKLPPASYLICDATGKVRIEKYWQLDYRDKLNLSVPEYKQVIMDTLEESTRIRLISDVPLGALLSGGLDSSAVVGLMAKHSSRPVKTFSIGFEEKDYSELAYAKLVAEHFKTEHREFIVRPDVIEILPKLVWHYNEPYADSSMLPTYYVARETRKYVTVALNGDGGDEAFAGYPRYVAQRLSNNPLLNITLRMLNHLIPNLWGGDQSKQFIPRLKRFARAVAQPPATRHFLWSAITGIKYRQMLYQDDFLKRVELAAPLDYFTGLFQNAPADTVLDRIFYTDINSYLPEDLLVKMDIATMANSLEGRSPFLDHKLIELSARIPDTLKIKGFDTKHILRQALAGFLPEPILRRSKMGFGVPIARWFRTSLSSYLESVILSERALQRNYFKPEALRAIIAQHNSGRYDHSSKLWAILVLEIWHRIFIDGEKP